MIVIMLEILLDMKIIIIQQIHMIITIKLRLSMKAITKPLIPMIIITKLPIIMIAILRIREILMIIINLIKIAMIDIYNQIAEREDIKMILQVHDELIFEIQQNVREEANLIVKNCMEQALPAKYAEKVQLKTDVGIGKNWFETH